MESIGKTTSITDSPGRPQVEESKPKTLASAQSTELMPSPSPSGSNSSHSIGSSARYPFRKLFLPEELRRYLIPTLEKLYSMVPEALPFRQPVDPKLLGCMVRNCLLSYSFLFFLYRMSFTVHPSAFLCLLTFMSAALYYRNFITLYVPQQ